MIFARTTSAFSAPKEPPPPPFKFVSKLSAPPPDAPIGVSEDFTTVATFNMISNMSRDIILRGAPPAIGRLVSTSFSQSPISSSDSRSPLGTPILSAGMDPSITAPFLSSGLPSAEPTYPLLALLEILRHTNQHMAIDGLDIIADAGSLAQVLRYQREATSGGSSPISLSPTASSGSSRGSFQGKKSRSLSFNFTKPQQQQPSHAELRLHALLHGNTLILLSDLDVALSHLEDGPETRESRLKNTVASLTHSPLPGSHDHRRAIRYDAGGLSLLVHFSAYASTATYPAHQPFIPLSQSPREFAGAKIDYHVIPEGIQLPLQHDLLVHCAFETEHDDGSAADEMTFCRIEKLMTVREGARLGKGKEWTQAKNLGIRSIEMDLSSGAALVAPFLKKLREEMRSKEGQMVLLQQLDKDEILVVEAVEPLAALADALKNYGAPFGSQ